MAYNLNFTGKAKEDIAAHKKAGNKAVLNKLLALLEELTEHPFTGTGKPEPLKHALSGLWSRRITSEHKAYLPGCRYQRFYPFCFRTLLVSKTEHCRAFLFFVLLC